MDFLDHIDAAMTVCDQHGTVRYMNEASRAVFGADLVGSDLRDCHPGRACAILEDLLARPRLNAYTIEKGGRRKLVYQVPVLGEDGFRGIVEISLPLPNDMPHFVREP
jgi:PAS domain-containing protein